VEISPYTGNEECEVGLDIGRGRPIGRIWRSLTTLGGPANPEVVEFSPQQFINGRCGAVLGNLTDADEILCHEMTHAARRLGGELNPSKSLVGAFKNYENVEEFYSIFVTNIYSSETGRPEHMKRSHQLEYLRKEDWDPDRWLRSYRTNYDLVDKFCDDHPVAAPMMSKSKADFNPLRVYYDW
jgi:hypothetical protein